MTFDESWQAFLDAPTTLRPTEGVREAWHKGRVHYAVWILRLNDLRLLERVAAVVEALEGLPLRPVRAQDLHVTVAIGGFRGERLPVHDDDVHHFDLEVPLRALSMTPASRFRLQIGEAHSFLTCAALRVDADPGLETLRQRVGPGPRFGHPFLPHVTVGSYLADLPTQEVAERLSPLRSLPPIELEVDAVELVDFDARVAGSPLVTRARAPLV